MKVGTDNIDINLISNGRFPKIFISEHISYSGNDMKSEVKVRISKKFTLYIPKAIAESVGLEEGGFVKMKVEGRKIVLEPIPDPFDVALKGPKFAKITFEEFERESEETQNELLG